MFRINSPANLPGLVVRAQVAQPVFQFYFLHLAIMTKGPSYAAIFLLKPQPHDYGSGAVERSGSTQNPISTSLLEAVDVFELILPTARGIIQKINQQQVAENINPMSMR